MVASALRAVASLVLITGVVESALISTQLELEATPIVKVVNLLKDLRTKVEGEGKNEAAQYDKFACFCKEQADNKQYAIEASEAKIEKLTAKITLLDGEIAQLNNEISQLSKKIEALEKQISEKKAARAIEHEKYLADEKDLADAIDASARAIAALKDSKKSLKDAKTDLVQIAQRSMEASALLKSYINNEPVAKFQYQSNDIIAVLQSLKVKFIKAKKELDDTEFMVQSAFEKSVLALTNTKEFAEKEKKEKEELSAQKQAEREEAAADKAQEIKEKTADEQFMGVLKADCESKADLWDQRSKTRAGEITALTKAIDGLEADGVKNYKANKKLVDIQMRRTAPTFLQRRSVTMSASQLNKKLVTMLKHAADQSQSVALTVAAMKVQASEGGPDRFVKVRGLIKDLIARLNADAAAEESQHTYCKEKMKSAVEQRDQAASDVEDALARIAQEESTIQTLMSDIATLGQEIADLQKAQLEATTLRDGERAENESTIAMSKEGLASVELALKVLDDFYKKQALMQLSYTPPNSDREGNTVADLAPEVFDSEYKGRQDDGHSIMGMLQVILSDFDRTETTTDSEEKAAEKEFGEFVKKTEKDIKDKEDDEKKKKGELSEAKSDLQDAQNDLKLYKESAESAAEKLEKLKPFCIDNETMESRAAKREKEIAALKEALQVLEDWQNE